MKEKIKDIFLKAGAEICGVANTELFSNAPNGFHPVDIYAGCKSVIVFAIPIPKGTALVDPRLVYGHFNAQGPVELDSIAFHAANEIEKTIENAVVVPLPSDGPYDYWIPDKMEGRGIISMKHAAVLAGIGALGKSTLLLNPKYGSMLSIGAVLTNLDLPSDEPTENICIKNCRVCIDNCPAKAIKSDSVNQLLCRNNTYETNGRGFGVTKCNLCRTRCPMALGKH